MKIQDIAQKAQILQYVNQQTKVNTNDQSDGQSGNQGSNPSRGPGGFIPLLPDD